jgi:hypothetical protein
MGMERREIPGFSDYAADEGGRIWTRRRRGGWQPPYGQASGVWRLLPMQLEYFGRWKTKNPLAAKYVTVRIGADGAEKRKRMMVHSLVALAFLGPRPAGYQVSHGPKGPLNNTPNNLSYRTPAQNKADELRDGTRYAGKRHHEAKQLPRSFWRRWVTGKDSKADLCREFDISRQAIHRRLRQSDPYQPSFAGSFEGLL